MTTDRSSPQRARWGTEVYTMTKQQRQRLSCTRIAASSNINGIEAIRFRFSMAACENSSTNSRREYDEIATLVVTPRGKLWLSDIDRRRLLEALQEIETPPRELLAAVESQTTLAGVIA